MFVSQKSNSLKEASIKRLEIKTQVSFCFWFTCQVSQLAHQQGDGSGERDGLSLGHHANGQIRVVWTEREPSNMNTPRRDAFRDTEPQEKLKLKEQKLLLTS